MTVHTEQRWQCLGDGHEPCDAGGEGAGSDREAEKHAKAARHVTTTHTTPEGAK